MKRIYASSTIVALLTLSLLVTSCSSDQVVEKVVTVEVEKN